MSQFDTVASGSAVDELYDPRSEAYIQCPYDAFAATRSTAPVAHHTGIDEWFVTGRAEIEDLSRDHARFANRYSSDGTFDFTPECRAVLNRTLYYHDSLFSAESATHSRFRRLFREFFAPRNLRRIEPSIRAVAEDLVREFADAGRTDLLRQFALPLPMTVICDIIGIPAQDRATVKAWHDDWIALQVTPLPAEEQLRCARSLITYEAYVRDLLDLRHRRPAEDLLTVLARAAAADDPVCTVDDAVVALRVMIAGGHETTTNLISNTVFHLLSERELWRKVVTNPELIDAAVEEGLRFDSPVQGAPRVTTETVRIDGQELPKGSRLRVMFAAAGRDPNWVTNPDAFRLDRQGSSRHLGFGHGIHFCLGAGLGRLEARTALRTLVEALPELRLKEGFAPQYAPGEFAFRGLTSLPVTWV
ncbi:cytochrome P450 [Streptomyces sp. NPDC001922]|uniref:cytochrome P450 n=1 Tax=Streptomyces sp. NPDC001922 TaxID=3364624 RepID=UPI00369664BA